MEPTSGEGGGIAREESLESGGGIAGCEINSMSRRQQIPGGGRNSESPDFIPYRDFPIGIPL